MSTFTPACTPPTPGNQAASSACVGKHTLVPAYCLHLTMHSCSCMRPAMSARLRGSACISTTTGKNFCHKEDRLHTRPLDRPTKKLVSQERKISYASMGQTSLDDRGEQLRALQLGDVAWTRQEDISRRTVWRSCFAVQNDSSPCM